VAKTPGLKVVAELRPAAGVAVIAIVLGLLLHQSLLVGRGLVPSDGIYASLPWAKTASVSPGNRLLSDQFLDLVPMRQFISDELQKGRFPLWNPHLSCGVPSLAMSAAVLYPINLLLSPLSPFTASGIAAFAKLFLAGLFTFLYLRRLNVLTAAAVVGALTFTLSGFLIVWLGHPQASAAVMLPALFYFVEGAIDRPGALRPWVGLSLAFAVMILGGHPPTAVHVTLALCAYAAFRIVTALRSRRLIFVLSLAGAMVAGTLVAAPQLFPFLEYYQLSSSRQSSEALGRWANHLQPATLVNLVLPKLFGSPVAGFEHLPDEFRTGPLENFNERTGYVGILALFLASVAVLRRRCSHSLFFAGLAVIALTIIYGVPPWPAVMRNLPLMASINHERLILGFDWAAAVLAGLGADFLLRAPPAARPARLAVGFAVGVAIGLLALWIVVGGTGRLDDASRSFVAVQLGVLACGLAAAVIVTRRWIAARWLPALCIGWTAVDLLWFAGGYNPAVPREHYYPATGAIRFLQSDPSMFRVFAASTMLIPDTAQVYGLDDVRGQDFMSVARYEELITGRAGDFFFFESATTIPPSFALLNAKYMLAPERAPIDLPGFELVYDAEVAVYRNTRCRDRAMIVFDHRIESDPAALLTRVRDAAFDPGRLVWLEERPDVTPPESAPSTADTSGQARITHYEPDRVTVEAQLSRPGFLLLLDTYFPGWTATVDGRATPIYRADYNFRAVSLQAGAHTVEFSYRPLSFRLGLAASGVTLGLLALLGYRKPR
jgi:membrane protein YfhO